MKNNKLHSSVVRFLAALPILLGLVLLSRTDLRAQQMSYQPPTPNPKALVIPRMWDEALETAVRQHHPALIFDIDLIDSNSLKIRDNLLTDSSVIKYITENFILGMDDFSVDPPPSVGFDSLRHLGERLTGLERTYHIVLRPCVLVLMPDSTELDRIPFPQELDAPGFIARVKEIMAGKNTIAAYRETFYRDTNSIPNRAALIEQYELRSCYDSVLYHLGGLGANKTSREVALDAQTRYSYMRLKIEGNPNPMFSFFEQLGRSGDDSIRYLAGLHDVLEHFLSKKKSDSAGIFFERIMAFTHDRNPDLLNDYAWELANHTRRDSLALVLVNEAIAKAPDEPNYYDTRALVMYSLQRPEEAVRDAEKALNLSKPEDASYFSDRLKMYKEQLELKLHPKPEKEKSGEDGTPVDKKSTKKSPK